MQANTPHIDQSIDSDKKALLAQLQRAILPLQGIRSPLQTHTVENGLGTINDAFPNGTFPLGAVHEFVSTGAESFAATSGFIAGLTSCIINNNGIVVWVSTARTAFPLAFQHFDIEPDRIIFIDLKKEKDALWVVEETLKCEHVAAVVGEIQQMDFNQSRRLQLAVEKSRVTGFIIRKDAKKITPSACVTRWQIQSLPSELPNDMPGVGFPRWQVELLKVRNGKPGAWIIEWSTGQFRLIDRELKTVSLSSTQAKERYA
ncbi:ImuA family protein [Pinibacter aurantiacus]|uniref:Error-prone repair protein ImuA n=1 Tax=Pinibacter aurantiacus TaxID=2851599 RepID=A0A9E2W5R4_9BACT|nr:Error-prone repair protein ImuA [Pinibacter aurantiacus]MBV4358938.1 Error-prone repair protein ImuA [Pinibacter aurantiacus]